MIPPKLFARYGRNIKSLSITAVPELKEDFIKLIIRSCPNLESLKLSQSNGFPACPDAAGVASLIMQLQSLKELSLQLPHFQYHLLKPMESLTKLAVLDRPPMLLDFGQYGGGNLSMVAIDALIESLVQGLPPKVELRNFSFASTDIFQFLFNRAHDVRLIECTLFLTIGAKFPMFAI
jgi:hypothetical protein